MQHLRVDLLHDLGDLVVDVFTHALAELLLVLAQLPRLCRLLRLCGLVLLLRLGLFSLLSLLAVLGLGRLAVLLPRLRGALSGALRPLLLRGLRRLRGLLRFGPSILCFSVSVGTSVSLRISVRFRRGIRISRGRGLGGRRGGVDKLANLLRGQR